MITIKNGYDQGSNITVKWCNANRTECSDPIPGGGSHQPPEGINKGLIIQAFDQNQVPIDSSIKISPLPDGRSINISYDEANKTWTIGRGVKSMIKCQANVNVEIGP
jgi:hypothetical protein